MKLIEETVSHVAESVDTMEGGLGLVLAEESKKVVSGLRDIHTIRPVSKSVRRVNF